MVTRILFIFLICFHFSQAKSGQVETVRDPKVPIESSKMTKLTYGYPPWNMNAKKIDSAAIILREGKTGRIIQISVEETEPDSSIFSGLYSLSLNNLQALSPEFYIPPQELLSTQTGMSKITEMIKSGDLKKKAFILRRYKNGLQVVEIYDSKDQAKLAMRAFRAEEELTDLRNRPLISRSALDAGALAEQIEEQRRAAQSLIERARLAQIEAFKASQNVKTFELLNAKQKKEKRDLAAELAKKALAEYQSAKLDDALKDFELAVETDPENRSYYFQYGISLYKAEQFNRSLVMLDLAEEADLTQKSELDIAEVNYYIGLNNYRLKLFKDAITAFDKVVEAKHSLLSASSQFYIGVCYFEQLDYKSALSRFQAVLDGSKDPKLDLRAEQYIEQILRVQQFEAERARKWNISGTFGIIHDSNVIIASDTTIQSTPTNSAGERLLTLGSLRYRPTYEADHEFATQLDITSIYTLDSNYSYSQTLRNTDPLLFDLTFPYTFKGVFQNKGFKLDIVPGYEALLMSAEDNTQKMILNSYMLKALSTLIMSENWFANYNLELRQDNANLAVSTGDEDENAINVKLANTNLFFLNKEKSKIFTLDGGFTHNSAVGKNFVFDRIDLGAGYLTKSYWDSMFNSKFSYFLLNYSANASARLDNSYSLSAGFSKKINEALTSGFNATYNINSSNLDAYTYKKYTLLFTLSYSKGF